MPLTADGSAANPLVGFLTFIASRKIIVALRWRPSYNRCHCFIGRIFCGFFCPFRRSDRFLSIDMSLKPLRQPQRTAGAHYLQNLNIFSLAVIVLVSLSGVFFPLFTDPLSLITRIYGVRVSVAFSHRGIAQTARRVPWPEQYALSIPCSTDRRA